MRALVFLGVLVVGVAAGAALATFLEKPSLTTEEVDPGQSRPEMAVHKDVRTDYDYIRLNSQFIIPVVSDGRVKSLVALSLSLEVRKGSGDQVFTREPKLRDVFLRVLFDHANSGGFDGEFTTSGTLAALRRSLVEAAQQVVGAALSDVLITDIARQDS